MTTDPESGRESRKRSRRMHGLVVPAAIALIRILASTWRVRRVNPDVLDAVRGPGRPVMFAFWHGQILPLMYAHRHENISVLISEHADGELIARVAAAFGFPAVRGSSTRGAVRGLLGLVRVIRRGDDAAVTPDGPRGPARQFAPGVLLAAQRAGVPLVPIAAHASRSWRLRSWDSFVVPQPFARISVAYGDPTTLSPELPTDTPEVGARFRQMLNDTCALSGEV